MNEGPTEGDQFILMEDRAQRGHIHQMRDQTIGAKGIVGDVAVPGTHVLNADDLDHRPDRQSHENVDTALNGIGKHVTVDGRD